MLSIQPLPNNMSLVKINDTSVIYESEIPLAIDFGSTAVLSHKSDENKVKPYIHSSYISTIPHDQFISILNDIEPGF